MRKNIYETIIFKSRHIRKQKCHVPCGTVSKEIPKLSRFSAFRVFRNMKRKWNPITMKMEMQIQIESGG